MAANTSRPDPDKLLSDIAAYVTGPAPDSAVARETALMCLADSLGCAIRALDVEECRALLGPVIPGTVVPGGFPVPGTHHVVDHERGAFNLGTMIRWLDYNDTWLAAEWGHPSDNIGAVLAAGHLVSVSDAVGPSGGSPMTVGDMLGWITKAHEIQGVLALENGFNRVGLDHVILVKIASAAVTAAMLGASQELVVDVLSNAFIDTGPLRTYRHFPNTGSRKSWAAGDASSRGFRLALMVMRGAMGYPTALSAETWGFQDVLFGGKPLVVNRPFGSYVMENVLFKVSFPAEFHAQTAVECGFALHEEVADKLDQIERIDIDTQESAKRIIDKTGPLHNPADRDHCIQYMTACALLYGELTPEHYTDEGAADPRIDRLRDLMVVTENPRYSADYLDPEKRSIANAVQVHFRDGSSSRQVEVEYPIGHPRRRAEAVPLLSAKLEENLKGHFSARQVQTIVERFGDRRAAEGMTVTELLELFRSEE